MTVTHIDLDAAHKARQEAKGAPVTVTLGGSTFTLPGSIPALVLVGLGRAKNEDLAGLGDAIAGLFGDRADEALRLGLDVEDLETILAGYQGEAPASES